jgi:predicted Abi (CAAX) family protease
LHTLGGVLTLKSSAFVGSVAMHHAPLVALLIVLSAGVSTAIGQSIVLFANRVRPARFVFSIAISAVLFAFGYAFITLSTWAVAWLFGEGRASLGTLWIVMAMSYAPILFSFLESVPYLGIIVMWALRTWFLLVVVVGVAAVEHTPLPAAFVLVGVGWLVVVIAQQTFGKPIAALGARLLDIVADVRLESDEQVAIDSLETAQFGAVTGGAVTSEARNPSPIVVDSHRGALARGVGWRSVAAILLGIAIIVLVMHAVAPVHETLVARSGQGSTWLRWPFDLAWIGIVAITVAALLAPLETLGWWAGWYGDELKPSPDARSKSEDREDRAVSRFVVYLDGIGQSSDKYTPDVETFLDAFAPTLPSRMRLIRGLMVYSVLNRPLDDDPILAWFWDFVDKIRFARPSSVLGMLVNIRNVMIVAVSADSRYGPIYNYGIAKVLYDGLIANGYRTGSGVPVTLIGYSGGGQMSAAAAGFLQRALDAPIDVISLGGVISGSARVLDLEHLYHLVGDKDGVERLGPILFWSRWRIFWLTYWNRALRRGRISRISLGPVGHQVPGGMFDPAAALPDGTTNLQHTIETIGEVLRGKLQSSGPHEAVCQSNYGLYVQAPWNRPEYYPFGNAVDESRYLPVAEWIGRLVLPKREERDDAGGVWFEVHHATDAQRSLVGKMVKLRWAEEDSVRSRVRAVTRDVFFSADADYSLRHSGWIEPVRLNHWPQVGPLESLAGSRPTDDMIVALLGPVQISGDGAATLLSIAREPAQISGRYYGLIRFIGPAGEGSYRVAHFNKATRTFDGPEETVSMPPAVADLEHRAPSSSRVIERSPLNADGWYVYGAPDAHGVFVVQSLGPRALLRAQPSETIAGSNDAWRCIRKVVWGDVAARKGTVLSMFLAGGDRNGNPADAWREGDSALVIHTYGGIGGQQREAAARGPVYFGHFAFGEAHIVHDPLADEPRFDIHYHQIYTHNTDGIIAGTLHWSRFLGDRQFGWAGVRPTCDILVRHDSFTSEFQLDPAHRVSVLGMLVLQLEAMAARYRIGDGTGATYVGPANNCSQDSSHALYETLNAVHNLIEGNPEERSLEVQFPDQAQRFEQLKRLAEDLRARLMPFGSARPDWSKNEFDLGSTLEDAPLRQVLMGLMSWRMLFPRFASETIVGAFLKHGASAWALGTDVIGGERPEVTPIAPMTF